MRGMHERDHGEGVCRHRQGRGRASQGDMLRDHPSAIGPWGGPDALACGVSRVRRTLPGACGELRHDYGLHVDSLRSIQEPMR